MTRQIAAALGGADVIWLVIAVVLHLAGQAARGLAWHGVLHALWPGSRRRSVCAWHMCGAGVTGVLSSRGGDLLRLLLARRELPQASCTALAGTLVVETSFETVSGAGLAAAAAWLGIRRFAPPSPLPLAGLALAFACAALIAARSAWLRRHAAELGRGLTAFRHPRCYLRRALPWQVAGRLLRIAALCCFLRAFGLPMTPAVVIAACVAQGSGNSVPVPGIGSAASAAAIMAALPLAAGGSLPEGSVAAFALVETVGLTLLGVGITIAMLSALIDLRRPVTLARTLLGRGVRAAGAAP